MQSPALVLAVSYRMIHGIALMAPAFAFSCIHGHLVPVTLLTHYASVTVTSVILVLPIISADDKKIFLFFFPRYW